MDQNLKRINTLEIIRLDSLPRLSDMVVASADMSAEYWTPINDGETRRAFFVGIQSRDMPAHDDPQKIVALPAAVFVSEDDDGARSTWCNASVRLRSILENVTPPIALQITYKGMRKNRTNNNNSAQWSVVELQPPGGDA